MKKTLTIVLFVGLILSFTFTLSLQKNLVGMEKEKSKYIEMYDHQRQHILQLKKDSVWLNTELDELRRENKIFSSMLGEIETQPHGHHILKTLWDKMNDGNGQ